MDQQRTRRQELLRRAAEQLAAALELLDLASAPPQIGAQLDLVIHHLNAELGREASADQLSVRPGHSRQ